MALNNGTRPLDVSESTLLPNESELERPLWQRDSCSSKNRKNPVLSYGD